MDSDMLEQFLKDVKQAGGTTPEILKRYYLK